MGTGTHCAGPRRLGSLGAMTALPPPDPATQATETLVATSNAVSTAAWLLLGGGVGAAAGSVLPWGDITTFLGTFAVSGTRGDGKFTMVAGLFLAVVGGLVLLTRASHNLVVLALFAACAVVAVAGYNLFNPSLLDGGVDVLGDIEVGYGLWLTLGAGVAALVGGALLVQRP